MNLVDKEKTRVDISLSDYEKLTNQIEIYKNLIKSITSSKYVKYKVDEDYFDKPRVEGKKYCEFEFDAKRFIEDNLSHFDKDKILGNMELETIDLKIK